MKTVLSCGPTAPPQRRRIPDWIKTVLPSDKDFFRTKSLLARHQLNTICESANCPNAWECWSHKTATFLILGNTCTRGCDFCSVARGIPAPPDSREPDRIAQAAKDMGLKYVVITSVTRDDLADGGAGQFRDTIRAIRVHCPDTRVEILTPDFQGQASCLEIIFKDAKPDVFSHNVETVPRLYSVARRGASYERSLAVLRAAKDLAGKGPIKSGLMVGLGETRQEILETLSDLRRHAVDMVTIGQYLKPSQRNLDVVEYHPREYFESLKEEARVMGFSAVSSGPLVRSSYRADMLARVSS